MAKFSITLSDSVTYSPIEADNATQALEIALKQWAERQPTLESVKRLPNGKKHIHCPIEADSCPYFSGIGHPCRCTLADPINECEDFAAMWDDGEDYYEYDWT